MADRSRDEKLAAAKKRLKKFQQKSDKGKSKKSKNSEPSVEKHQNASDDHPTANGSIDFNEPPKSIGDHFDFETGKTTAEDQFIQMRDTNQNTQSFIAGDQELSETNSPKAGPLGPSSGCPVGEVDGEGHHLSGRPTASTERIMQLSRHLNGIINDNDICTERSQSETTEATIRDLETRNVELAALLEKRNHSNEQLTVQISQLREYNQRLQAQIAEERASIESSLQRELTQARSQVSAHLQTVGILVAEKSELQSQLAHSQRQAQQRLLEIEEVSSRLRSSRARVDELEASVTSGKESSAATESQKRELRREVERFRSDLKETQLVRDELIQVRDDLQQRLQARSQECSSLERTRDELRKQLELSQIYIEQLSSSRDCANEEAVTQVRALENEKSQLQNRVEELDAAVNQLTDERDRLSSQYREYIQQLQSQAQQLSQQLIKLSEERDGLRTQNAQLEELQNESRKREERLREELKAMQSQRQNEASGDTEGNGQQSLLDELRQEKSVLECTLVELRNRESNLTAQLTEANTSNRRLNALLEERELESMSLTERLEKAMDERINKSQLLEEMQSDKTALSRALTQNKDLKMQLLELENSFVKTTNEQMEVTTQLQHEQHVSKELATRLQQQEVELNEVRELLSKKEEELRGLKQSYYTVTQQMFDVECSEERKRAMEGQTQLVEKLQKELTSAQDTINNLTSQNSELRVLVHQAQAVMSADKEKIAQSQTHHSDSQPPTPRPEDPRQEVSALQASIAQLQMERDQLLTECQAASAENDELRLEVENLRPAVHEGRVVTADRFAELQEAQEMLEEKFNQAMEKQAQLNDQNDYLEHLVMQLEGETATIGDYISMYQQQRRALIEREKMKSRDLELLDSERQVLRNKLAHLQTLVLRLLQEKEGAAQLTEYLTTLEPPPRGHVVQPTDDWPSITTSSDDGDSDDQHLPNGHNENELSVHSSSIKKSGSASSSPHAKLMPPHDQTAQEIIHLISELGVNKNAPGLSNSLVNFNQDINYFRPCKCCTGKLQLV